MSPRSKLHLTIDRLEEALATANERIAAMQAGVQAHLDNNADEAPKKETTP